MMRLANQSINQSINHGPFLLGERTLPPFFKGGNGKPACKPFGFHEFHISERSLKAAEGDGDERKS